MQATEFLIFLTKTFLEFICLIKILFGNFVQNKKDMNFIQIHHHHFYNSAQAK